MRAEVLGGLRLVRGSTPVEPPPGRAGLLLRWFLLRPNEDHANEALIRVVWPEADGIHDAAARHRLHVAVSRLRRYLDPASDSGDLKVVTIDGGYRLVADERALDRVAFESSTAGARTGEAEQLALALRMWRGVPYEGFPFQDEVAIQRSRLLDQRRALVEVRDRRAGASTIRASFGRYRLVPPTVRSGGLLIRRRLLDRMGVVGDPAVVVVRGPAGFGKSVLLSQWAAEQDAPVAWLGLQANDDDSVRLWATLWEALLETGRFNPGDVPVDAAPGSPRFVDAVASAVADHDAPVGIVLDDAHHLADLDVCSQIVRWTASMPGRVTLVIGSRTTPPSVVAALGDHVRSITPDELRFSPDEARAVAPDAQGADLTALVERTGGWPIAVAHLGRGGAPGDVGGPLHDYVVEEVLGSMPSEVRSFVLRTAVLDCMTDELCAAATRDDAASAHTSWLWDHGLLVAVGDAETGCFRYDVLLRDILRRHARSDPSVDAAEVLRRAAVWCRGAGRLEQALGYAARSREGELLGSVAGPVLRGAMARSDIDSFRRWLDELDPDVVAADRTAHDLATLAVGWLEPRRRQQWIESRGRRFGAEDDLLPLVVAAYCAYFDGRAGESVALAESTRSRLDAYFDRYDPHPGVRDLVLATVELTRVSGLVLAGRVRSDSAVFIEVQEGIGRRAALAHLWLVGQWSFLAHVEGDDELAGDLVARGERVLEAIGPESASATAHLAAGRLLVTKALIDSEQSLDRAVQQRIVARLSPMLPLYRRLRWNTELIPLLIALRAAHHRSSDDAAARTSASELQVLLSGSVDVPMLVEADERLGIGGTRPVRMGAPAVLTRREQTVLDLLDTPLTYREIAEALGISPHTVSDHVRSIRRKLGVRTRSGAVVHARHRRVAAE